LKYIFFITLAVAYTTACTVVQAVKKKTDKRKNPWKNSSLGHVSCC